MKIFLTRLLGRLTMYQTMLWYLRLLLAAAAVLSFFDVLPWNWWHVLGSLLLFLGFCWTANQLFARLYRVKANVESQYITAEILALIVGPLNPLTDWWVIAVISALAMGSKYLFAFRNRHVFNPAAFAVLTGALIIGQGASWWVGSRDMLWFVAAGGLVMLTRLRWFHLALSFLLTYLAALSAQMLWNGSGPATVWAALQSTVLDSAVVFFAVVMLIEPLTAPAGRRARMAYGAFTALAMVLLPVLWPSYGYAIETALLAANLVFFILVPKSARQTATLMERTEEAKGTWSFWFKTEKPIRFRAGQFLEWTLPHPKSDSRGIRRFFTIAASPGQGRIRLVTKFAEQSSSFKRRLSEMQVGDSIIVSGLDGEFVLPPDPSRKLAFIAGGVGITPFLSMLQDLIDRKENRNMTLFYANKTPAEIGFRSLFDQARSVGLRRTVLLVDKPDADWSGLTGFITPEIVEKETPDWQERTFYVSGPEPMVAAYGKMLSEMGVPADQQVHDYFPGYEAETESA